MQGSSRAAFAAGHDAFAAALGSGADRSALGEDLFAVTAALDSSAALRRALVDPSRSVAAKQALADGLFGPKVSAAATDVLKVLVSQRWADDQDLGDAIESLAVEAVSTITLRLRAAAPLARIAYSIHTNANSLDGVERGTLDCAIGMFPALPRDMHVQGVRTDLYICVMRRDHDLARLLTLDRFVAADHVLVTLRQTARLRGSDQRLVESLYMLWQLSEGRVQETWTFTDRMQALAAGGLSE